MRAMLVSRSALLVVLVCSLAACGSDDETTTPNTALPPAESVREEERSEGSVALGELVDTGYGVRAGVLAFSVGGDDGGPWLVAETRVEGLDEGGSVPNMGIVCAGGTELGGWQADSTLQLATDVPAGSFDEGSVHLLLPGDGRYGEPIPECAGPAFVEIDTIDGPAVVEVPATVLAELNAAAAAFNAG